MSYKNFLIGVQLTAQEFCLQTEVFSKLSKEFPDFPVFPTDGFRRDDLIEVFSPNRALISNEQARLETLACVSLLVIYTTFSQVEKNQKELRTLISILEKLDSSQFVELIDKLSQVTISLETTKAELNNRFDEVIQLISTTEATIVEAITNSTNLTISKIDELSSQVEQTNIKIGHFEESTRNKLTELEQKTSFLSDLVTNDVIPAFPQLERKIEEVPNYIVGESYFKWDAKSSYFPTLVFAFSEIIESNKKRTSQLKLRLPYQTEEITDEIIDELRFSARNLHNLTYNYGQNRGFYVASSKRYKTTVYANSRSDMVLLLSRVLPIINEQFDEDCFSFTEKPVRTNINRRIRETTELKLNTISFSESFPLRLTTIKLLINGVKAPVEIYNYSSF